MRKAPKNLLIFFLFMVIENVENGDQVSKQGFLCPQDSRGEGDTPKILEGGGEITPMILGG